LRTFIGLNGWDWAPKPSIEEAERAVVAVAAGEWDEAAVARWLRGHLATPRQE